MTSENPTDVFCTVCGSTDHTRSHCPLNMPTSQNLSPCPPMTSSATATSAKFASCCAGALSAALRGPRSGWQEFVRFEALAQNAPFETTPQPSGDVATAVSRATGGDLRRALQPVCWWFGCVPDYDRMFYDTYQETWTEPPCKRCGALECLYSDLVGDTRHERAKGWLTRLIRRPARRIPDFNDSVPF